MKLIKCLVIFLLFPCGLLVQSTEDSWRTFFENSGFLATPDYNESIEYFQRFEKNSPYAKMFSFGTSPQGRELYCFVVSKDKMFTPVEINKRKKPVVLILNGIHAGEIEGKDACMILLREILITKEKENLIDNCVLMIIPVFNVDGHERKSPFNRINQNGPTEMGWRTTAHNLNLNRDFMKADAPEMKSFLKLFNEWLPDFFIDTHTTNGADYQYTITYAIEKDQNTASKIADWVNNVYLPYIEKDVLEKGFLIAPYVDFKEGDPKKGLIDWVTPPRLSHGYAAAQNRPGLLIETHMLKPYRERVFSTKALIASTLEIVNNQSKEIVKMNAEADQERIEKYYHKKEFFPLAFELTNQADVFRYKGIKSVEVESWITGSTVLHYTGEPYEIDIPFLNKSIVKDSIIVPSQYIIPKEFSHLIDIIKLHGVNIEVLNKNSKITVERTRFRNVKFTQVPYEGRTQPEYEIENFVESVEVPEGTFIISTNQRTLPIIVHLLEPKSPDSFVKWGFFNSVFERKEYFEAYSMEPIARKMAEENPAVKEEFLKKVESDETFRANTRARLNFFYERSPYFDKQFNLYPVMKTINKTIN